MEIVHYGSLIVTLVSLFLLFYFLRRCRIWYRRRLNLLLQGEDLVAWMPLNNTLEEGAEHHWTGVLFQLGTYTGSDLAFEKVILHPRDPAAPAIEYKKGDFKWMNVVAQAPASQGEPITPEQALALYPNERPFSDDFPEIWQCAEEPSCKLHWYPDDGSTTDPWTQAQELMPAYLRLRKLHAYFQVEAILTWWQGARGYEMRAIQETGKNNLHQRYRFYFANAFKVEVYEEVVGEDGLPGLVPKSGGTHAVGTIDLIEVQGIDPGMGGGDHQDPAWYSGGGGS